MVMQTQQPKTASNPQELICDEVLKAFGTTLDLRDNETAGHSQRVTRYSHEIAEVMGCATEELDRIARAAYLHDIGKIAIPDAILRKAGKLTREEMEVMRSHAWIGYNMVSHVSFLAPIGEIVLSHHERYDGNGYPQGLVGDQIPLGARIFAVADTLDAMTTDRPYRKALPFCAAREEILRESGHQFDPKVVQAFLSIPQHEIRGIVLEEKRRFARVPLRTAVNCKVGKAQYTTRTVNISEGGTLLENANELLAGQELEIEFRLHGESATLKTTAKIVRRELPDRIGMKFLGLPPGVRKAIQRFVAKQVQV